MKYWTYTATNQSEYIQMKDKYLATTIVCLSAIPFYKLTIRGEIVYSFQKSDKLMELLLELKEIHAKHH